MKGPEEQLPGVGPARPSETRWPDPNVPGLEPEQIIAQLRASAAGADWAWYQRRGHWSCMATGDDAGGWPEVLDDEELAQLSAQASLRCYPTGSGPTPLGWLLARPDGHTDFAALALRFGFVLQRLQLQRAQAIQQVLYDITYLASSTLDRQLFMQRTHELLVTLIDAENLCLALLDPDADRIHYPYYFDQRDESPPAPGSFEPLDRQQPSLTAFVLMHGEPLLLPKEAMEAAQANGPYYCQGSVPEFWMGIPLKDGADRTFGVLSLQVYDRERRYGPEDQALFQVIARDVAMALDRILRREDLEATVGQRTQELSEVNARLREQIAERERAEQLQAALFRIAELSSASTDMPELLGGLHRVVGELLYAHNFYIALYDDASGEVSFPYFADERRTMAPVARRGSRGYTEYTIRQRRPCIIDRHKARLLIERGEITPVEGTPEACSWLGIPLYDGKQVRGVLAVQSYREDVRYSQRDQELLTFVSRHIDTALSRRSAAEAIQQSRQALEVRVQERTRALDAANARLLYENNHDALTRLPNRSFFQQRLGELWTALERDGAGLAVMFLDLDRFKRINDQFGHPFGDLLLVAAGERLSGCLRETDLLARLGGDEFAILVPGGGLDSPVAIAQRIIDAFDRPLVIDDHSLFASCSIGIVVADPGLHHQPDDLLRDADTAMYRVKQGGRDNFAVFNQELRQVVSDQVVREGALRKALKNGNELEPFFQPIIEVDTGRVAALEALIRWRQPDGSVLAPGAFLPELEGLRLIGRLDTYMLTRIAATLAEPAQAHWPVVHVNCSSYSIVQPEFADEVLSILAAYGVAPSRICLELTEGALVAEPERAKAAMEALDRHGVSVVLDDFGAGFSSLGYVHEYRFRGLKIDKSFVLRLADSARSVAIVRAIVRMAESLGLDVVAEGVEDDQALQLLKDMGARHAQGYLFARPLDLQATRQLLARAAG
ncbi:sensor domain-containing phosphodiesterase [Pseudomonas oryzihabitans]|uniref:sensor domain-containing phosphodiesterase n=1 Tax=Pseudomonas oryzihabitans TaxID=47885 RepID=UPI0028986920|nr:EAL domain-containing protein [Pseudomonas oryzihabitans]